MEVCDCRGLPVLGDAEEERESHTVWIGGLTLHASICQHCGHIEFYEASKVEAFRNAPA